MWFLYSIDHCIQSFKVVQVSSCKAKELCLQAQNQTRIVLNTVKDKLSHICWLIFHFGTKIWTYMFTSEPTITLLFAFFSSLSLWLSFVSSVCAAEVLWTSVHRWLCGCCCHLLMSPVMMWGLVFLEMASQSQDSIISFKQNKVRQRQLWTSQEREAASLSSANHFANTFEVVTCLWKM